MTLEVSGSQNSTSPTRHLLSGLEVDVKPVESNTPQVCEMHEDFSLRKLQFWENDELGPEVGWRQVGNETLLAWNLTNLKLNPRLYFNYQDQIDVTSITVSYTIVGCKMKTFLYWNDVFVMDGPINCNGTYTNLEFVEGVLGPEDSLNFRLEISPLSNAKEILLSDLKVTFVAKQSESQPLISEIKTSTAANINVSESATTENTSKVNSPGSDDDDIMMWALLLGTFTAFVIVSIVVAILVCYLRHSTKIKVSSPFNQHANYSQVLTNEV